MSANPTAIVPSVPGGDVSTSTGSSSGSRPVGGAGLIFDRIRENAAKTAQAPEMQVSKPEEKPKTELAPPAPATAELAKPAEGTVPAAIAPDKKTSQSVRALIKASNMDPAYKEEVANLAYLGRAMQEQGMSLDALKLYKEQGITPESVTERIKLHPTFDDAKRDAAFAAEMRRIGVEFNTNPAKFVLNLQQSSVNAPAVFGKFIEATFPYLEKYAKPAWTAMLTDGLKTALYNLGREGVAENNEDKQTAVRLVQEAFGFNTDQAPPRPYRDPKLVALEKQNAELLKNQTQAEESNKTAFLESVVTESRNAVYREIASRWEKTKPAGLDAADDKRAIDDIFRGVEADLQGVQNFVYDMQLRRNGPRNEQSYRDAVKYAFDRALPFIPTHQKVALDFWGKHSLAVAQVSDAKGQQAAQQIDAAGTGTAGAVVPEPVETPLTKMKKIKAQGPIAFKDLVLATLQGGRV